MEQIKIKGEGRKETHHREEVWGRGVGGGRGDNRTDGHRDRNAKIDFKNEEGRPGWGWGGGEGG